MAAEVSNQQNKESLIILLVYDMAPGIESERFLTKGFYDTVFESPHRLECPGKKPEKIY